MNKVVLIVEDDPKTRSLIQDSLNGSGFETIQATNGRQGVELAKETRPDIILMDINMPDMNGYTACCRIKENEETKRIPVIMVTANGFELNKKLASRLGADGYVTKPFVSKELIDEINSLLVTA